MTAGLVAPEQRVVIDNVRWSTYVALLEDAENRRGRIAYDQGVLEIMSPSKSHEQVGRLIGRAVEAFTEERGIDLVSVASMTIKLESIQRGFEADEAYYVQHAAAVRGKEDMDWTVDPPPDLVIEVDISRSSIGKLPIYAAFHIPEVWRYRGDKLQVSVLSDEAYGETDSSRVLPGFPFDQLARVLGRRQSVSETDLIREFRAWVRNHTEQT